MAQVTMVDVPLTLRAQLVDAGFPKPYAIHVAEFLEQVQVQEGEYLMRQDEESDDLFFIERGRVSVHLELADGTRVRLHTLGVGTLVGELGLYLGTTRTASVVADWPTTAYRLTQAALSRMEEQEPELAAAFHEFVARVLSERLVATTRTLRAVLR
jgi:SulP family sulfate permease